MLANDFGEKRTFWEYIRQRRVTDTPSGDFVADVRADEHVPTASPNWSSVHFYLLAQHATPEAIRVARRWWTKYCRVGGGCN